MGGYKATIAGLAVYLVLVWFLGSWLHLKGSDIWVLRIGLAVLGLIAAGILLWFQRKLQRDAEGAPEEAQSTTDIDLLVRDAERRLRSSRLGRGLNLAKLPLVFVMGPSSSAKTTTLVNSSTDAELLAGHVHQDNNVLPTSTANIFYTREAAFVDVGGTLLSEQGRWARLIKLLRPGQISSAFGKGQQAPRAAIVCFSAEQFFEQGASGTIQSAARSLATRLHDISQLLDISLPVYVLFTKVDRVPFFTEFARTLTKEEANQVVGATLPVRARQGAGVYAEEETKRLNKAFDDLFYSLAEKRLEFLARENEPEKLPGIYEFPRELRKLRTLVVQFLVELGRPSQLRANPFLRGFYFSGVRPVIIDDVARAMPAAAAPDTVADAGATRIFSSLQARAQAVAPAVAAGSRKVPQWVFLTQLFHEVLFKDRVAFTASRFSTRVNLLRRALLVSGIVIGVLLTTAFVVSFLGNRAIESSVQEAARDIPAMQLTGQQLPALADLQRLDRLRQSVAMLATFEREGVPWRLRWGLYIGDRLYPQARQLYFARFREMMFGTTAANLLSYLRSLPDSPSPNDSYESSYNALRAYLITTSNNDKSTQEFLSPVLMQYWNANHKIEVERLELGKQQFDFYSTELTTANPYSLAPDSLAVARARQYLSKFAGIDRYYLPLLAEASSKNPSLSFNESFKDSVGVISSSYKVKGAFTRDGFSFMQDAIRQPSHLRSEEWVLGKSTAAELDPATLQQKLSERYNADFINEWHTVLEGSHVVHFGPNEAEAKLAVLSGPTSPLLELLWFISHNTNVGAASASEPFLPVQAIEPPGPADKLPDQYVLPSNKDYIVALSKLQSDYATYRHNLGDPNALNQALNSAGGAKVSVTQVMGTRVDQKFHTEATVRKLLLEPITGVEDLLSSGPADLANKGGAGLCKDFDSMTRKYPFNSKASEEASIDVMNAILAPKTGSLWQFYDKTLAQSLPKRGLRYEADAAGGLKLTSAFVSFFNRAAALSSALYSGGSAPPKFQYTLKELPSNVEGLALKIGSDTLSGTGQQKTFSWSGNSEDIQVTTHSSDILQSYSGQWAIFHFVGDAISQPSGAVTNLQWILQSNGRPIMLPNGKQKSYNYQLQVSGTNPFEPYELSGLRCVAQVAHAH